MALSVDSPSSLPAGGGRPVTEEHISAHRPAGTASARAGGTSSIGWLLAAYLVATICAEIVTVWRPVTGMIGHTALLLLILVHAGLLQESRPRNLVLALALAPLTRILSLAMPLGLFPQVWWYTIISIPLFVAAAIIARIAEARRIDLGLRLSVSPAQWLIASLGFPLGILEYAILRPAPLSASIGWRDLWLPALILLICTGFLEELIFRGLLQHLASRVLGSWGIVFVSGIFAALHIGHRSVVDVGFVFAVALLFAVAVRQTRSLAGVTIAHGLTNSLLFLVCPFVLGG
jgi:uncharacterized protein